MTDNFNQLINILTERYAYHASTPLDEQPRVVVILGAGASFWSGLRSWTDPCLRKKIIETINGQISEEPFYRQAWKRLAAQIGLANPSWKPHELKDRLLAKSPQEVTLDMICSVASDFAIVENRVRDVLQEEFGSATWPDAGPPPQLGYELLAHMLKHRFIDDIVTFNFDEVLDVSLDNELGENEYYKIVSDHQVYFPPRNAKPHLIKLHGTISHPATLRFTVDRTKVLSDGMLELLDRTLFYTRDGAHHPKCIRLISLGYRWNDPDFVEWVSSRQECIKDITVVTLAQDQPTSLCDKFRGDDVHTIYPDQLLAPSNTGPFKTNTPSIDLVLWAVWNAVEASLSRSAAPKEARPCPSAARHILLSYLFGPRPTDFHNKREWVHRPLRHRKEDRFKYEVLLHLLKCKGMVNLSVMARDCRVNRYRPEKHDLKFDFLEQSTFADVKETFFAKDKEDAKDFEADFYAHNTNDNIFVPSVATGWFSTSATQVRRFIADQVKAVFDGTEVEIVPGRDQRHDWLFVDPEPLETMFAFQSKSSELLKKDWTHLFAIAESGEWLLEPITTATGNRQVLLIETSMRSLEQWKAGIKLREKIEVEWNAIRPALRAQLAWWKHNRHLTLAYKKKGNNEKGEFLGGIYFRRSMKTSQISPVYVEKQEDCAELLLTFLSYCRRVKEDIEEEMNLKRLPSLVEKGEDQRFKERTSLELKAFEELTANACAVAQEAPIPEVDRPKRDMLVIQLLGANPPVAMLAVPVVVQAPLTIPEPARVTTDS